MCKVRFSTITKRDLVQRAEPAAAGRKRGRNSNGGTPRPEKIRVRRRDARFLDDPNDYGPAWARALRQWWAPPSPPRREEPLEDELHPFLPFWGGGRSPLDFFLRRPPSPPRPLPYPPPPLPYPLLPPVRAPPAALGPPPVIDLTAEGEGAARPGAVTLIDLTGDAPIEVLSDSDSDASLVEAPAPPRPFRPAPLRPGDEPRRDFAPFRIGNPLAPPPTSGVYRLPRPSVDA